MLGLVSIVLGLVSIVLGLVSIVLRFVSIVLGLISVVFAAYFCQVRVMDEGEDSNAGGKQRFINNNINKTNKNYPVREKQTG